MKSTKLIVAAFILLTFKVNGQNDSSFIPKMILSVDVGTDIAVDSYSPPGPAIGIELELPIKYPFWGIVVKTMGMSDNFKQPYYSNNSSNLGTVSQIQANVLAGPCFSVSIKKITIRFDAMVGLSAQDYYSRIEVLNYGYSQIQNVYSLGVNIQYPLNSKWFIKLNSDFIDFLSEEYDPPQYFTITTGAGFRL